MVISFILGTKYVNTDDVENVTDNIYSFISGVYSAKEKLNIDGEFIDTSFILYLLEDGTF